jgi:hypothetical protein
MISNIEVYRAAISFLDQHGEHASIRAATRVDEMLDAGDLDGVAVWKAIRKAVEELAKTEPDGAVH